jgi:hypothetical protein
LRAAAVRFRRLALRSTTGHRIRLRQGYGGTGARKTPPAAAFQPAATLKHCLPAVPLAENGLSRYIAVVNHLTKQEQLVIWIVLGLLVTGGLVKIYRATHPAAAAIQTAKP